MLKKSEWNLNTSNIGKWQEFKKIFISHGIELIHSQIDLREIKADPLEVVAHKASQLSEGTLVEDTCLDVEGSDIGINVKWLINHLADFAGQQAVWIVFLAYRKGNEVVVFRGEVKGHIVEAKGSNGFGFDPYFLPLGSKETLAQSKPDQYNARVLVVEALIQNKPFARLEAIYEWDGAWQQEGDKS